jgi:Legume lectin domain/Chitobiase/beta-hexosaminidase C-terminal domain
MYFPHLRNPILAKNEPFVLLSRRLGGFLFRAIAIASAVAILGLPGALAQTNVTMQHYDISRTGQNTNETILTPANVNTNTFGKLFSYPVDGWVYAQPLYMPGITMGAGTPQAGTTHNVIFIATEHDSLYAFDADSNAGSNSNPLWQVSLLDNAHGVPSGVTATTVPNGDVSTGDIVPEIGITSTGVIDPSTNTWYVVGKTKETANAAGPYIQRLHAIDITTGAEKFAGPVMLSASVPGNGNGSTSGTLHWDPKWENNRASLLLLNGIVYIGFGSHGDNGPWHGWILAYHASTLAQTGAWCSSPNGSADGIWMGGSGLAAEVIDPAGHPFGRMFTATGNGTHSAPVNATVPLNYDNTMNFGDSVIKLDLAGGVPTMTSNGTTVGDDFTPHDQATLNNGDTDQASGGVLILPASVSGGKNLLVQLGKTGRIYIINRDAMGGYNPNNSTDPEESGANVGGLWGMPAYWNGNVYVWGTGDNLRAFSISNGVLSTTATSVSSENAGVYSPTPTISANGTSNAIVWDLKTDNYGSQGRAILYAHDATNVSRLLYSSESNVARDNPGNSVKFIVPTVINGKVYTGSESQVNVFGLLNGATQAGTPSISPASESFNPSVQVTITDSTPGAKIYYTTDGSTPTTASTLYSGPFTITTTSTVQAIAAGTGLLQSPVASATYSLVTQTATPTFSPAPGAYTAVQSVTISSATAGATFFYTTDGTTPSTSSTKYTGPVSVGATETLKAIATAPNLSNSAVASGLYTIDLGGVSSINFGSGFTAGSMVLNGSSTLNGTRLRLTDGNANEAASSWFNVQANIQNFTTDFSFQINPGSNPTADGFTFAMQANNASAVGPLGGGLGYGPDTSGGTGGIPNSVAVKFDLYSNAGEGVDSTGLYTNGASPTVPAVDMTNSGVNLHTTDIFHVHMTYDGTNLTMTVTDTTTNASFTHAFPVNIPSIVGGNTAYVGFTGGTGGLTAIQEIINWTFVANGTQQAAAAPTFSLAAGTYLGTQTVSLGDTTPGASIFYTLDGTTPGTSAGGSTMAYAGAITVTGTETISAIATAPGFTPSSVSSAKYTIESQVVTPTFSPAPGAFNSAQQVALSTTTAGATIFYTTDGTTPGTSVGGSTKQFTAATPIAVSSTTTIKAIATASGFFNSNVATGTFTINATGVSSINLSSGFTAGAMLLNGSAALNGTALRLTDTGANEAASAWFSSPANIATFTTNFSFQITPGTNPLADGFTFTIQGGGANALGPSGGGLGYGPDNVTNPSASTNTPIAKSVAVKFDLFSNAGEGIDSTGIYTNGASPTTPFVDMTGTVDLHSGHVINAQITYDGKNLTLILNDPTANTTFTHTWQINIPSTVGGNIANVGFTGGTGGDTAIQQILSWTLSTNLGATAAPTFSPAAGTYSGSQSVKLSDTTPSAAIFYTTDGTAPATKAGGSTLQYSTAITVSSSETINAIALAPNFSASPVVSAKYVIQSQQAATPTFSLASGTYVGTQSVTLSDTTAGATIYYTTNGSAPTISSTKYTAAISVAASETIKAIAVVGGFLNSNVASAMYTITGTPIVYETKNLPAVSSGPTFRQFAFSGFPDGTGTILDATKVGDNVTFTVNVAQAATYDVKLSVKQFTTRGTWQLSVNGVNVGPVQDEYANTGGTYAVLDIGTVTISNAGNQSFKFTVTGKDAASSGFTMSFDLLTLTPR